LGVTCIKEAQVKSHARSKSNLLSSWLFLLVICGLTLLTPRTFGSGNFQQTLQQQDPKQFVPTSSPFQLVEEPEIQDFDKLSEAQQEERLANEGPLLPHKSNLDNFSMRAFIKGNSPLLVDYALEPNSTAVVTVSVGADKYTLVLKTSELLERRVTQIVMSAPVGDLKTQIILRSIGLLVQEFLKKPSIGRNQTVADLPEYFGPSPQVGKITIQAFTNGPGVRGPAYFRLYGLALGRQAIPNDASFPRPTPALHHAATFAIPDGTRDSTAFNEVILTRSTLNTKKREKVNYRIHSLAKFNGVKVVFYRVEEFGKFSVPLKAYEEELGGVLANEWLQPPNPRCEWDGKSEGAPSKGPHDIEVRGWVRAEDRYWASAWSAPKQLRVK
jgi:hypothetical protein